MHVFLCCGDCSKKCCDFLLWGFDEGIRITQYHCWPWVKQTPRSRWLHWQSLCFSWLLFSLGFSTAVQPLGGFPNDHWVSVSDRYDINFKVTSASNFTLLLGTYLGNADINVYKFEFFESMSLYVAFSTFFASCDDSSASGVSMSFGEGVFRHGKYGDLLVWCAPSESILVVSFSLETCTTCPFPCRVDIVKSISPPTTGFRCVLRKDTRAFISGNFSVVQNHLEGRHNSGYGIISPWPDWWSVWQVRVLSVLWICGSNCSDS